MKVLVVYDLISEYQYKTVVEMTPEEYAFFRRANGYYVNLSEYDAEEESANVTICSALDDNDENKRFCRTEKELEYFGKWKNQQHLEDITDCEKAIFCGWVL